MKCIRLGHAFDNIVAVSGGVREQNICAGAFNGVVTRAAVDRHICSCSINVIIARAAGDCGIGAAVVNGIIARAAIYIVV